jgi:MFS family permease
VTSPAPRPPDRPPTRVLAASLAGSVVEWYDLFVYGTLVFILSKIFFPAVLGIPPLLLGLIAFVAGAAVRPLGGAVFGRMGDLVGRRPAFVLTTFAMGLGSVAIGLLPTYAEVGLWAPLGLVSLRVVQGLALGGEYGGGVIYVAESVQDQRRGLWTSGLQAASTLGLLLATSVVLATLVWLGPAGLQAWGWRLPFLGASALLLVAVLARWRLSETLLYRHLQDLRRTSRAPLKEVLRDRGTLRTVVVALALVGGASVVWHTAQFYTQIFLQTVMSPLPDHGLSTTLEAMAVALALAAPFYLVFGALSDRFGRLRIILVGSIAGSLSSYPAFVLLARFAAPPSPNLPGLVAVLWVELLFGAMCYAPLGAYLVELFPGRIRYTAVSLVHGVGTGDIGDATVVVAPALALGLASLYGGILWSSIVPLPLALVAFLLLPERRGASIWKEADLPRAPPVEEPAL